MSDQQSNFMQAIPLTGVTVSAPVVSKSLITDDDGKKSVVRVGILIAIILGAFITAIGAGLAVYEVLCNPQVRNGIALASLGSGLIVASLGAKVGQKAFESSMACSSNSTYTSSPSMGGYSNNPSGVLASSTPMGYTVTSTPKQFPPASQL